MVGGLTVKADRLASAIASGRYATQREAAAAAGMHEQTASKVLKRANVQRAIEQKQDRHADRVARLEAKTGAAFEAFVDSGKANPMELGSAFIQLRKLRAEVGEETDPDAEANASRPGLTLILLQVAARAASIGERFGAARLMRALSPTADKLNVEGEEAQRILALKSLRALIDYALGE
jgi:hypothetical protein